MRRSVVILGVLLVVLAATEVGGRAALGLGDPPVFIPDSAIEYLPRPEQQGRFLGNRYIYNAFSMRSAALSAQKTHPRELRVLVLGDSVVNGGLFVDQAELATEIAQEELRRMTERPVVVANASANSWGPPNLLAYVERFGFFGADVVVLVLSSHDAWDVPDGSPQVGIRPDLPANKPVLAIAGLFDRALGRITSAARAKPVSYESASERALSALGELLQKARSTPAAVGVLLHWERGELEAGAGLSAGHAALAAVAREAGATVVPLETAEREAVEQGRNPYRDSIHLGPEGQRVLAKALVSFVLSVTGALREPPPGGPAAEPRP